MMKHKRSLVSIAIATIVIVSLCAVCASTSVTAADNSKATVQTPSLVGAAVPGGASVCSIVNDLYLFAKGTDNSLWWKHWTESTKTWTSWMSLGGYLTSDPAVVSTRDSPSDLGKMYAYVRGGDGALWTISTVNVGDSWSTWTKLGGYILPGTGPAACFNSIEGGNNIAVFVTGGNHAVWHVSSAHGWQALGGYATSSPAAIQDGYLGYLYVYIRGRNGALWEYDSVVGASWSSLGGGILPGTSPAACQLGDGHAVFVTGNNHAIWWMRWFPWGVAYGWRSLNGYLTSKPTATGFQGWDVTVDAVDVLARGNDGALWRIIGSHYINGNIDDYSWGSWMSIGGM